jgi:tetratricopeptide (TPR) repeat protein
MAQNREAFEQAMNAGHNAAWEQSWGEAIAAYGRAIQEFPEDPDAHIHLGLSLLKAGRLDDALKVYTRAHQLASDDPIPLEKSAEVLETMGRLREAAQQYVNVAEIYLSQPTWIRPLPTGSRPPGSRLALSVSMPSWRRPTSAWAIKSGRLSNISTWLLTSSGQATPPKASKLCSVRSGWTGATRRPSTPCARWNPAVR